MGLKSIDTYVTQRQLRWAGHVARMSYDRLPRKMLSSWVPSKPPKGAPEFTYGRGLFKALKKAELSENNWFELAENREQWRTTVKSMN